jgi:hypothetical protein
MDWKTLLEQAESVEERAEIIRVAFVAGIPKHEIELELEKLDGKKRILAEGPPLQPPKN